VERTTIAGETEVLGENLPQRHFVPPQIRHDQVRFRTPDRSGGKPATNRLSYGAAFGKILVSYVVKNPPMGPIVTQIDLFHILKPCIFQICIKIIVRPKFRSPQSPLH
jgi:hypothetical protein